MHFIYHWDLIMLSHFIWLFFFPSDVLRPILPELSVIMIFIYLFVETSLLMVSVCGDSGYQGTRASRIPTRVRRSALASIFVLHMKFELVHQCPKPPVALHRLAFVSGRVMWTDLKPGSWKQELRWSHSVVGCGWFCFAAHFLCSVSGARNHLAVIFDRLSVLPGQIAEAVISMSRLHILNANISVNSRVSVLPGWFKLQHPGWYRVFLRGHQSVRELGKHDHHVLDEGLFLREAGGGESGGMNPSPVSRSRLLPVCCISFTLHCLLPPDRIRSLRERPVCLQDKQIPHVWIHDQLHP